MNSREKGKRGEREAAAALRESLGIEAVRGVQYAGSPDSPDVRHSLAGVHFEVKRTESLNVYAAMEQAERDAGENIPVVLHRRNNKRWLAIVPLNILPQLAKLIHEQAPTHQPDRGHSWMHPGGGDQSG